MMRRRWRKNLSVKYIGDESDESDGNGAPPAEYADDELEHDR